MTDPNRDQNTSSTEPVEGERDDATTGGGDATTGGGDIPRNEPWRGDRIVTDAADDTGDDEDRAGQGGMSRQEQGTGTPR